MLKLLPQDLALRLHRLERLCHHFPANPDAKYSRKKGGESSPALCFLLKQILTSLQSIKSTTW
jgi:hypothetical protein